MSEPLVENTLSVSCECGCHIMRLSVDRGDESPLWLAVYELHPLRRMTLIERLKHVYATFRDGSLRCDLIISKVDLKRIMRHLDLYVKD